MKKPPHRLKKETLKQLSDDELNAAAGGDDRGYGTNIGSWCGAPLAFDDSDQGSPGDLQLADAGPSDLGLGGWDWS
jgi:hypothetical protein